MTYSILAYDVMLGQAGVAVASGSLAVGARVPWAKHGLGVVVTQAYTNPALGALVLEYLSKNYTADEALSKALEHDPSPAHRQVAVIDYRGDIAVHDGDWTPTWHGYIIYSREPVLCIANLVKGPEICQRALEAYSSSRGGLAEKLLAALEAGHKAGGDRRGDKSAALLVVGLTEYSPHYDRIVDLRVDFHPTNPVAELKRIYSMQLEGLP